MPTLTFRGGSPAYIDAQGQFHEAKLGPHGYVYKTTSGMWAPIGGGVNVVGPSGGTPAPAAAPAAAAPPPPAPVFRPEDDPIYSATELGARQQRDVTLTGLTGERTRGLGEYGFTEGPGGPVFDPNNPFSKASLLKQTYDRNRRSSAQTMGAAGQLYAGAFQNQQDYVNRQQLGAEDQLQKSLIRFLAENTQRAGQAATTYGTTTSLAAGEAGARFAANPPQ